MKKLLTTLSVSVLLICMLSVSVFAADLQAVETYGGYEAEIFAQTAQGYFDQMYTADEETYAMYLEQFAEDEELYRGFELVGKLRELEEAFISYGQYNLYENEAGEALCYQVLNFEESDYVFIIGFDQELSWSQCDIKALTYLSDQDVSAPLDLSNCKLKDIGGSGDAFFNFDLEELKTASGNAVIGILTVFFMLVFISLIISLFKFIPSEEKRAYEKQQNKAKQIEDSPKVVETQADAPAVPQQAQTDDQQLVAVIAAAIAAYEGKSADSFVVRTINKRKWK